MIAWISNLWLTIKRERNRRRRWRERTCYTWPNDWRRWQDKFTNDARRSRQS